MSTQCPLPPNRQVLPTPEVPTKDPKSAAPSIGPEADSPPSGRLDEEEVSYIIRTTLRPEYRADANILKYVNTYLRCRDNAQAAREAGLTVNQGYYLKNKPDVHACITKLTERSVSKYGFDASEVVEKVKEVMSIDPIELLNDDGTFKDLRDMTPEARRAIKKFKAKNIYEDDPNGIPRLVGKLIEVELYDKMRASELLGREKELFVEKKKVEHDVTKDMASVLLESMKRADDRQLQLESRDVVEIEVKRG